jgi:hypothetical protein
MIFESHFISWDNSINSKLNKLSSRAFRLLRSLVTRMLEICERESAKSCPLGKTVVMPKRVNINPLVVSIKQKLITQ